MEYIYDSNKEFYETETTFGEVREAFESGVLVFFKSVDDPIQSMGLVVFVKFDVSDTFGEIIVVGSGDWNVSYDSTPQTLEELDACTLYTS